MLNFIIADNRTEYWRETLAFYMLFCKQGKKLPAFGDRYATVSQTFNIKYNINYMAKGYKSRCHIPGWTQ